MAQMVYDPETGAMIDKYDLYLKKKAAERMAMESGIEDMSGAPGPGVVESGGATAKQLNPDAKVAELQGATAKQEGIGSLATTAGMATANPYLTGAGLGLQALSMVQKQKNAQAAQQYQAEIQKYNARQQAIARMAQLGQSLKA